jgi:hypothetical protein
MGSKFEKVMLSKIVDFMKKKSLFNFQ